jgi:ABC-type polysaccharide/polyol phosphate export permease
MSMSESTGHSIDTLRILVAREFRMRYKGSTLGLLWALLTPLGTVVVLQFLFGQVLGWGGAQFAVFLYTGLLPWTWFQASLQSGSTTLNENRDLVRTPFFSKPLLPWTVTCANFVLYLFSLPVLGGMMFYNGVPMTGALAAFPAIWLVQGLLIIGLTMLMAAIGMLIRDWPHMIALLLTFWFYLTPIFYNVTQVPAEFAWGFALNPMTAIVTAHRAIVLEGRLPDWASLAAVGAGSLLLLGLSLLTFRALEDSFIDRT